MKNLLLAFSAALMLAAAAHSATAPAFPFTYYIHDTTDVVPDYPLPSIYQFAATPVGSSSHIVVKVVNTSNAAAFMGDVIATTSASAYVLDPDFKVTGLAASIPVPAGGSLLFQVNFTPSVTGPLVAYMQTTYQVQVNGCSFTSTDVSTQCPSGVNLSSTLNGNASAAQLVLSYQGANGTVVLQPNGTPINFGNVSTSASSVLTFTLANDSAVSMSVPAITVPPPTVYSSSPFALDISSVPTTLAAGTSATFTVTFAPGQTGQTSTAINVGTNTYPIQGDGIVIADVDALQISYVDSTGVRTLPQAASPINFGQLTAGASTSNALTFTVANPSTSYNGVSVTALTVSGSSYALSGLTGAATFPFSLAPGASFSFVVTFNAAGAGTYTGSLAIGSRVFSLTGLSASSPLPSFSLVVTPSPLASQEQASVSLQLSGPAPLPLTGTIQISFAPTVQNVTSDAAIVFLSNNTTTLPIAVSSGSQNATYTASNGQTSTALPFQTGTTAGSITFTVNFPSTAPYTQSFTIPPAIPQIATATAVQSSPNLVLNITGYDNTYSAGALNFVFYDTSGNAYPAIAYNAAGAFQGLFFGGSDTAGGAFSLQATFPVTGDITKIGSVAVSVGNSVGQANTTLSITAPPTTN